MARQQSKTSGADHNVMRELNRSLVLDMLKENSPLSRAAIAKATTLAKPTVSAIVDDLLRDGLVSEIGIGSTSSGGGRPPIMLEYNARARFLVGVHIGVRQTTVVVADSRGEEITRISRPTPKRRPREALRRIAAVVEQALAQAEAPVERVDAIGVCIPGLVDQATGVCLMAPNLDWRNVAVAEVLAETLPASIYVHNTAQAAAVAECVEGAGEGAREMVFLYVGTGVGAGVIVEGRLYHGMRGIAGEVGHWRIPGGTEPCRCGNVGCLETLASGPAIARGAEALLAKRRRSTLAGHRGPLTAEDVGAQAAAGDAVAVQAFAEAGRHLGLATAWLVNLLNPKVVVVGGGVAAAGEVLLAPLREAVASYALDEAREGLTIQPARLGQDAEVRGAVLLARQYSETYFRVMFQS